MELAGPIKAGPWQLIGDGIIVVSVDVQYDVIWRPAGSDGGANDVTIATFSHHFDPQPVGFDAEALDGAADGIAADAAPGDQLVLRFTVTATSDPTRHGFIPNGDGVNTHGRIPSLILPP
jgi:hypothetical protein